MTPLRGRALWSSLRGLPWKGRRVARSRLASRTSTDAANDAVAALLVERDALRAQCHAVGLELAAARAEWAKRRNDGEAVPALLAERASLHADCEALMAQCQAVGAELSSARTELAAARSMIAALENDLRDFSFWYPSVAETALDRPDLEFRIDAPDLDIALAALRRAGCIVIRGDDEMRRDVAAYRELLDQLGYFRGPVPRGGGLWEFQPTAYYHSHRRFRAWRPEREPTGEVQLPLHDIVRRRLYDLCCRMLAAELLMSTTGDTATLRTVDQRDGLVKWHQDISPVDLTQCLTFWFAIDPDGCGRRAPGLKLVVPRDGAARAKVSHLTDANGYHELHELRMRRGDVFWVPAINPGDIVVFDAYCIHSSFAAPHMRLPRTSVDLRYAPFDARRANSILAASQGLVLVNRSGMLGPRRIVHAPPPEFVYGHFSEPSSQLDRALQEARNTPWEERP